MPASRARVEVEHGLDDLHCPVCAAPVYTAADGPSEQTCEHVRFFIDWEGELALAEPDSFVGDDQKVQQAIIDLVEGTESWDDFLDKVPAVLPASALVLELVHPAGRDGEEATAVVAFDFTAPDIA
ncbi:hypothetical protein [Roseisolibacter sp. H3M3-2]|uniref:hypothetical protein n=1 Tax=Roseisolibacter sp. H3M3-2 TaxID=3031323 RepID=UPI0023DBA347|nr:hypothetical protein [Roseisolibacter sp. H3M3-2]MDF1504254.1 hypothetical protein [Roseisolibacter sp. H3M3-2]